MTRESARFDPATLYEVGKTRLHHVHPLTKLAWVPAVTVLAIAAGGAVGSVLALAGIVLFSILAGVGRLALSNLKILIPIAVALVAIHVPFGPDNRTPISSLGGIVFYREGLDFALITFARLGVFVIAIALALRTTHPKALVAALMEKGVSHKICYSYLAGAELIPEMRRRAQEILEAQQSRGFDTDDGILGRARTLIALMKPLLVGALISVETRALALESRGFSLPGRRTSTVPLAASRFDPAIRSAALFTTLLGIALIASK